MPDWTIVGIAILLALVALISLIRVRRQRMRDRALAHLQHLEDAVNSLRGDEYVPKSILNEWLEQHEDTIRSAQNDRLARYLPDDAVERYSRMVEIFNDPSSHRSRLNQAFKTRRMAEDRSAFDAVESFPLTERQREAIVTDEDNTFVVAGAGTGKTSTIVGKVDYLTRRHLASPDEIIILAFNNKAAGELQQRLALRSNTANVTASTFHALGLRILGDVEGRRPRLSTLAERDSELKTFISSAIVEKVQDRGLVTAITRFFSDLLDERDAIGLLDPEKRNPDIERSLGLRTFTGVRVASREEVLIGNWMTFHGVAWEYERPYPFDQGSSQYRQYTPDFYLPAYDIYLEHFGIDRNNKTAPHVDNQGYLDAMRWKRALHETWGTTLVETYSYMFTERTWTVELKRRLEQHGVELKPLTEEELRELISGSSSTFTDFVSLITQFLSLFKAGNYSIEAVKKRATTERDRVFLQVFEALYHAYEHELQATKTIDFNDMINRARRYVQEGRWHSPYKYIIVDEFQDISENRLGLTLDLRAQVPHSRLFVVGDDWQSINRFAGADVSLVTNIADRVGPTERVDLDTAFRYSQPMLDVSSKFVMKNPDQLRKSLRSHVSESPRLPICVVLNEENNKVTGDDHAARALAHDILSQVNEHHVGDTPHHVMVLGRYNKLQESALYRSLRTRLVQSGMEVEFLTVHRAKGKEADFVVVLDVSSGEMGFPSNISDDHVMRMVMLEPEDFPFAEERRLFYVALTRAKIRTYVVAPREYPSRFITDDLQSTELAPYVEVIGELSERYECPRCHGKTIKRKVGRFRPFWGCTNYPTCRGTLETCPSCQEGALLDQGDRIECTHCEYVAQRCPRCYSGIMVLRRRRSDGKPFMGCSNWKPNNAGCGYSRDVGPTDHVGSRASLTRA